MPRRQEGQPVEPAGPACGHAVQVVRHARLKGRAALPVCGGSGARASRPSAEQHPRQHARRAYEAAVQVGEDGFVHTRCR